MTQHSSSEAISLTKNALTVLERRYLKRDEGGRALETPANMFQRVADAISQAEATYAERENVAELSAQFYALMTALEFLPNSPTLMNAGRELGQLSACFVLPVEDTMESIFEAVKNTALIHKSGGGTGFSFSRIRPANDVVLSTKGVSSGPLSFMNVFDTATETIKQGGTRRGANMGILRVDHPDIMDFIMSKRDQNVLTNFNISVGITEEFMEAVKHDRDYDIVNPRTSEVVDQMSAPKVFEHIVDLAWNNGEPGIIFLDRLNRDNPTPHIGEIESTNPCGEQPLLPYESCNLGSINLSKMVDVAKGDVDWKKLERTVTLATRFLDNVIDVNNYPIEQIREMSLANRKIGLGIMGWADMLIQLQIPYNSSEALTMGDKVMAFINEKAHIASRKLAAQRGAFPNFKGSIYDKNGEGEIRNATCTTIAPTGTISIIANSSSGIEPLFAVSYVRQVMDNDILVEVNPLFEQIARDRGFYSLELMKLIAEKGSIRDFDQIPEDVRRVFVTAHDITPEDHIKMQSVFQKHTDNAVSKTVNFCNTATRDDVTSVYQMAYENGCKGVTIYRDGSRDNQVLSLKKESKDAVEVPMESGKQSRKRDRPRKLGGATYQMETGCGPLYVTINEDQHGLFEVFTTMGKAGGCAASQCEALGRLVSLAWRSGVQARQAVKQLIGISCHKHAGFGNNKVTSCADALAKAIQQHVQNEEGKVETQIAQGGACPECGGPVEHEGGCCVCHSCGYSECA